MKDVSEAGPARRTTSRARSLASRSVSDIRPSVQPVDARVGFLVPKAARAGGAPNRCKQQDGCDESKGSPHEDTRSADGCAPRAGAAQRALEHREGRTGSRDRGAPSGPRLGADDLELHVDVAPRRMRVGTDLLMCLFRKRGEFGLTDAPVLDRQLHR